MHFEQYTGKHCQLNTSDGSLELCFVFIEILFSAIMFLLDAY